MRLVKITTLLFFFIFTLSHLNAQISRVCTDITPVFMSANVSDCTLTADVFDAQGQGPSNFTYTWRIDGNIIPNPNPEHMLTYSFDEPGNHYVIATMRLISRPSCVASVRFNFAIDESCDPSNDGSNNGTGIGSTDGDDTNTDDQFPCPSNSNIEFHQFGGGGLCTDGTANITGVDFSNVASVEWTWALGGHNGAGAGTGTTSPIEFPSGDWNGHDISITATVTYNNGQVCDTVWRNFPMECGSGPGNPIGREVNLTDSDFKLYPNPAKEAFNIQFTEDQIIEKIIITRFDGNVIKEIRNVQQEVSVQDLQKGIYFIQLTLQTGKIMVKKLIIN